jgi:hypothetical protein
MVWTDIFGMWQLYAALLAVGVFGFSYFLRGIPVVGKTLGSKSMLMIIGVAGLLFTGGFLGDLISTSDTASMAPSGFAVSDLQVTTDFTTDTCGNGNVTENTNVADTLDVRLLDACAVETAAAEEVYSGIITVTRTGSLEPYSCQVTAQMPSKYQAETSPDGSYYNILEETTLGEYEVWLADGAAATINSPKEKASLTFGDGVATRTLGIAMDVDEEGHDALDQYSYKSVVINICGKPFTVNIHRMD